MSDCVRKRYILDVTKIPAHYLLKFNLCFNETFDALFSDKKLGLCTKTKVYFRNNHKNIEMRSFRLEQDKNYEICCSTHN